MIYLHILFTIILLGPWILAFWGFYKNRKIAIHAQNKIPSSIIMVINAAVLYALAYNIIFFMQEFFLAWGKYLLGLRAYLYHNNHSWEGSHPMTPLMQGFGASAIFFIGLLCLIVIYKKKQVNHWSLSLIFWLAYHGLIQSLPQVSSGMVEPGSDVGQAMGYLGIGRNAGLFFSTLSLIFTVVTCWVLSKKILEFSPVSVALTNPLQRMKYVFQAVILPAVCGTILIVPFKILPWSRAFSPVMVMLIGIPWIFAFSWTAAPLEREPSPSKTKLELVPIFCLLILLAIFQLILARGVVLEP